MSVWDDTPTMGFVDMGSTAQPFTPNSQIIRAVQVIMRDQVNQAISSHQLAIVPSLKSLNVR